MALYEESKTIVCPLLSLYPNRREGTAMSRYIDKEALVAAVMSSTELDNEQKSQLIRLIREQKKYGLVWEDSTEDAWEKMKTSIPVLNEVDDKRILNDKAGEHYPNHAIIEADNLHALIALTYTHAGMIDVIYIDPPYNTGNKDFVYNDTFIGEDDAYRHSKWLSFMEKRLQIAKTLLSERGVIFISIDDNEQANLKLLCDEIFGENNFVASMIWRGGRRNMSKWISTSHEYMLLYTKSIDYCDSTGVSWRENKRGINDIYKNADKFVKETNGDYKEASRLLKEWYKKLSNDNPSKDHSHYCWIDSKGVYFASDISRGGGGGPQWEIRNPETGEFVKTPSRGWAYSTLEELEEDIKNDKVHFNGTGVPCRKIYLKDNETQILETVFYRDRRGSSKRLKALLGADLFPFPKDEFILKEKIESFSTPDSIVLDFFAGSGTTLHATMLLNTEDGGHRQCILVTNNENNICEEVTYERNKRVIEGYTTPKGEQVAGLNHNNLRYYKLDFNPRKQSHQDNRELFYGLKDLLCIKENIYHEKQQFGSLSLEGKEQMLRYFAENGREMLMVYDTKVIPFIVSEIAQRGEQEQPLKIYIFADGAYPYADDFASVVDKVSLVPMPYAYYRGIKDSLPEETTTKVDDTELTNEEQQVMMAEAIAFESRE